MKMRHIGLAVTVVGALACASDEGPSDAGASIDAGFTADAGFLADAGPEVQTEVPDFALEDVNDTSSTFGQSVSPRQYLEKVSGWYFTHAS